MDDGLMPGDSPTDPRKHFIASTFFNNLWAIEEKWNSYCNQKRLPLNVPENIHEEEMKLFVKHFPHLQQPEQPKPNYWANLWSAIRG